MKIRNMEELATRIGISRPTISRYFNDPASVRPTTRSRIEEGLKKFDYVPNLMAVNLNRKRTRHIGILVPYISDPFYAEIVRQIEVRSLSRGYWAVMLSSHGDPALEAHAIDTFMALKVAGAVIAPLGARSDRAHIERLQGMMPIVFLDSRFDQDVPFVGTDNQQSIPLVVDYLLRTGETPCFLEMPLVNFNALERREAYVKAMRARGHEPILLPMDTQSWDFERVGFDAATKILAAGGFPSRTVLCANDRLAIGVIAAANASGRTVGIQLGADLRVAGHDDHPLSRYINPALTTVAQDFERLAESSVEILIGMIDDEPAKGGNVASLEGRLVMRGSA